jgi:exodeoxyribonuclease V alpha subunit
MTVVQGGDAYDAAFALGIVGPLHDFNAAGVLSTSDVHVALRLTRLGAVDDEVVALGAAFAARAPRLGHVCVDLAEIRGTASSDTDLAADLDTLPWPDPARWLERLATSSMVGDARPLQLDGTNLYLDRLWADERAVAADLRERSATPAPGVDGPTLAAGLRELFKSKEDPDLQRMAAAACVLRRVAVVAGGPGTGKTRTVARVLALLDAQAEAATARAPLVALAAPTGKAAARLEEAVRGGADDEDMAVAAAVKNRLRALDGVTLHRLLGFSPGNRTRFRHNRLNRLPFDVVVVDETSMVSLSLMARLLEAVRPEARLILVGDPEQLASVEAGAVLGDIVGPASKGLCMDEPARAELAAVTDQHVPASEGVREGAGSGVAIGNGIVVLRKVHRYGTAIAALAEAIQRGDADATVSVLREGGSHVEWIVTDEEPAAPGDVPAVRAAAVDSGRTVIEAARTGDAVSAIAALGRFRLLCAHRHGPDGVATWMQHVEDWLRAEVPGFLTGSEWYVGRPLIVTENDYGLRLYNGDTGVVVEAGDGRLVAAFERGGGVAEVSPTRLAAVDTVYAMTVHKSQGSQFHTVAFVVPAAGSRLLTRELLYTAVTRAQERLILVGAEEPIRAAVGRPISRASGLRAALWGKDPQRP